MDDEQVAISLYDAVGGHEFFVDLVERFYDDVAVDPILAPLYPDDLTDSRRHTSLFLVQYWGGLQTYSEERGHPRLRMRHLPFAIGQPERDRWFELMAAATLAALADPPPSSVLRRLDASERRELERAARSTLLEYFDRASTAMINS